MLIGYARCSTSTQDLTAQHHALHTLGVDAEMVHVDHGFTGTKRDRPGLGKALAACRGGDTFVMTKLDRLARSLPDATDIADELTRKGVTLNIGGSIHNGEIAELFGVARSTVFRAIQRAVLAT
ncbi:MULTISPECIES: recombinase family protein [unclassified Arthrobacter]|uniref:recombinase family protein n=1 Tax=unclassified Arthrobacter TaxID=235627 RepID=UPI00339B0924